MDEQKLDEVRKCLQGFHSSEELNTYLGELTLEEENLLKEADFTSEPTQEELSFLGPDFIDKLMERTLARIKMMEHSYNHVEKAFDKGLALLEILTELEVQQLFGGKNSQTFRKSSISIAEDLINLWPAIRDQAHKSLVKESR